MNFKKCMTAINDIEDLNFRLSCGVGMLSAVHEAMVYGTLDAGGGESGMKAPAEFDDIFLGIELTEREARFLDWITGWDDYTIQNMRTVLEKVRSDVSEIRSENEKLKADLARVTAERDAAIQ